MRGGRLVTTEMSTTANVTDVAGEVFGHWP